MRPLFALALVALIPGCAWSEDEPSRPSVAYLQVSRAMGPMPGAVEVIPHELSGSPGLLRLRGALEEARTRGPDAVRVVTMEEHAEIFAFLLEKWDARRDTPAGGVVLVRYVGKDYGVRSST